MFLRENNENQDNFINYSLIYSVKSNYTCRFFKTNNLLTLNDDDEDSHEHYRIVTYKLVFVFIYHVSLSIA
jgi:hypothetical protein